ncbi:hypothetical protein GCM10009678_78790 [Actinomadura kijaniata]
MSGTSGGEGRQPTTVNDCVPVGLIRYDGAPPRRQRYFKNRVQDIHEIYGTKFYSFTESGRGDQILGPKT